ncbi:MAG: serine--tRNA ligase, partial [Bacteroidota bacterium]
MLQVNVLRNNTADVKKRLAIKHFNQPELVDTIIALDDDRKRLQAEFDTIQSKVKATSKEIGKLMGQGNKEAAEAAKLDVANWKAGLEPLKEQMAKVEKQLLDTIVLLPNLPAAEVPEGCSPEDNIVVREGGDKPNLPAGSVPHWDL